MFASWDFEEMKALLCILGGYWRAKPAQRDNKKQSYLPEGKPWLNVATVAHGSSVE